MTGFGAGAVERAGLVVRAEVRSVNHRFLQVKLKLPAELAEHESALEQELRRRLERGAVTATITVESAGGGAALDVDLQTARRYKDALFRLAFELGLPAELSLERIATLPGVLSNQASARGASEVAPAASEALATAAAALVAMREREGEALAADLARHVDAVGDFARRVEERMPSVVAALQESLRRRLAALLAGELPRPLAQEDLAREVALLADRADVSEEVARLASHVDHARALLRGDEGGVGRRLDFLVQELLREVNTIGSKCSDANVAREVVEAKAALERLREQVQNVE